MGRTPAQLLPYRSYASGHGVNTLRLFSSSGLDPVGFGFEERPRLAGIAVDRDARKRLELLAGGTPRVPSPAAKTGFSGYACTGTAAPEPTEPYAGQET
jgi:hypothetical protein